MRLCRSSKALQHLQPHRLCRVCRQGIWQTYFYKNRRAAQNRNAAGLYAGWCHRRTAVVWYSGQPNTADAKRRAGHQNILRVLEKGQFGQLYRGACRHFEINVLICKFGFFGARILNLFNFYIGNIIWFLFKGDFIWLFILLTPCLTKTARCWF